VSGLEPNLAAPECDPWALPVRRRPSDGTHLVNGVRAAVDAWRGNGYPGASTTTRRLFTYWFEEDHVTPDGMPFRFYFCQREAVETFVYLTEIREVRSIRDLLDFASHGMLIQPGETLRQRLAFKMATGSGKTMAMSLCVVWAYFHAIFEPASPMATKFLIVAPNVIVFERLRTDFEDGGTFRRDPLVPPEWANDFEMTVILQDELAPATTRGVVYLTNIQRLYDNSESTVSAPVNPVDAMVGGHVNRDVNAASAEQLVDRVAESGRLVVINDEAHHVWSEKLKWNQAIESLHDKLGKQNPDDRRAGVVSQLDFSATPKDQRGILFRHIVVDYPLAQAVRDGIVKTPLIGEIHGATPELGTSAVQRYRRWLDVAVGRWRKFNEALEPAGKRPVLFVMCENTQAADEVGDYLRQRPDFSGDRLLVIHTNRQGEVTKEDLDIARRAAREVDGPGSRIRCIVSVLMLREGWDVRNVCVIVTLRSLTAKAKILPEQALGRGLRRMTPPGSGYDERVVVIEHDAFRDLWSSELDGGLIVEKEDVDRIEPGAVAVFPDEGKRHYDIAIPHLSRVLTRSQNPLAALRAADVSGPVTALDVPDVSPDEYIKYRGLHLIGRAEVERDEFLVPYAEDPSGVITWYTKSVAKAGGVDRLAGTFAILAPMVRDYLKTRVFKRPVDLADKVILRRLAENDAQQMVVGAFQAAIRALTIAEVSPELIDQDLRLSDTPAFPWSRETVIATRTVFNLTPVDNALERRFAQFLDQASDVDAFAKLTMNSRFALEYISTTGALRYYYPDFLIRLGGGGCLVVETKGLEDIEVALKDQRARRWCRDATALSGISWGYEKVPQRVFDAYTGDTVEGLRRFLAARDGRTESQT
jgi:type III restriction enzyme